MAARVGPRTDLVVVLVVVVILAWLEGGHIAAGRPCNGRQILNASTGIVTDGPDKYDASAHCEWLIDGEFIYLLLLSKCLYHHVHAN